MTVAEYRAAVTAWNAVQDGGDAPLSPDDERMLSEMLDAMPVMGSA